MRVLPHTLPTRGELIWRASGAADCSEFLPEWGRCLLDIRVSYSPHIVRGHFHSGSVDGVLVPVEQGLADVDVGLTSKLPIALAEGRICSKEPI